MNRHEVLLVVMMVFLVAATAQAQQPQQAPQQPGGGAADPAAGGNIPNFVSVLGGLQLELQNQLQAGQPANTTGGAPAPRSGGRGTPRSGGAPRGGGPGNNTNTDLLNSTLVTGRSLLVSPASGAWWTNTALLTRLGLTDDQKLRIERVFESNRQNLTTSKDTLEKEETQLARLLDAESLDRGTVTTQIYKVVQARGEMERINALMTLEMREVLTRAQWTQLQVQQSVNVSVGVGGGFGQGGGRTGGLGPAGTPAPTAPAGAGGRGGVRGQ